MRKLLFTAIFAFSFAVISPAFAANWTGAVNAAINSGHYDQIDVIAAKNPADAGAIAEYVLQQAANNAGNPGKAAGLLGAATPLSGQVPDGGVGGALGSLQTLLNLANNPAFQKSNPKDAAKIFTDLLNISGQPNFGGKDPHFHDQVLADASSFLKDNPGVDDDLLLAQGNDFLHNNPDTSVIRHLHQDGPSPE